MSILKIARLGHPVLRAKAKPLSPADLSRSETQRFIDDMVDTMRDYRGVGLAAPQVYAPLRIVVIGAHEESEDGPPHRSPLTVVVNPAVKPVGDGIAEDWEGCLSIPDLRGRVPRPNLIEVEGVDRRGTPVGFGAHGFLARVIQHEVDHLDGIVFLDRMKDLSTLTFLEEQSKYWLTDEEE